MRWDELRIEEEDGRKTTCQALTIKIRRSKADQQARGQEVDVPESKIIFVPHTVVTGKPGLEESREHRTEDTAEVSAGEVRPRRHPDRTRDTAAACDAGRSHTPYTARAARGGEARRFGIVAFLLRTVRTVQEHDFVRVRQRDRHRERPDRPVQDVRPAQAIR